MSRNRDRITNAGNKSMEGVSHRTVTVNGINMHIAEKGEGPVVLFLHGFPELWYSWRHQIVGIADKGYHVVAPDLRGYGDTDVPVDWEAYTIFHLVGDVVSLIDVLGQGKVFVVGHDWGAIVAWHLCLLRPDKVKALLNLSVPFRVWDPDSKPTEHYKSTIGDDFYICRFQNSGVAEVEFSQMNNVQLLTKFYMSRDPRPLVLPKNLGFGVTPRSGIKLPSWLSEDEIKYFASKFDKTGYSGALNYYRALDLSWELLAPWKDAQVKVHTKFIMGDLDMTYNFPGVKNYIHNGGFQKDVPLLDDVVIMEGVSHFINQEKPHEITEHIYDFIKDF